MGEIINLAALRRQRQELAAWREEQAKLDAQWAPPTDYIEQLRLRLRCRLGIDVDQLHTRRQWHEAADTLFSLEMSDLVSRDDTPGQVKDLFPEFDL